MHAKYTPKIINRFWAKVDRSGGPYACWPWTGATNESGYGVLKVPTPTGRKVERANRLALIFTGHDLPDDALACHRCNVRACCNPAHIYAGDHRQNHQDAIDCGTALGRLSESDVIEARRLFDPYKMTFRMLGARYGCHVSTMRQAVVGKTWSHLPGARSAHTAFRHLREDEVIQMRAQYARGGVTFAEIARDLGMSDTQVSGIIRNKSWKHLPSVEDLKDAA